MLLDRVDPYPVHFLLTLAVWSDPDGSGSIQRSWSVGLIRTHQVRGSGPCNRGLWLSCVFFWINCYAHLYACYLNPLFVLNFLQKSKKFTMWLWYVCECFCDIFTWAELIKMIGVNFPFDWYILGILSEFSCMILSFKFLSHDSSAWHLILWWLPLFS